MEVSVPFPLSNESWCILRWWWPKKPSSMKIGKGTDLNAPPTTLLFWSCPPDQNTRLLKCSPIILRWERGRSWWPLVGAQAEEGPIWGMTSLGVWRWNRRSSFTEVTATEQTSGMGQFLLIWTADSMQSTELHVWVSSPAHQRQPPLYYEHICRQLDLLNAQAVILGATLSESLFCESISTIWWAQLSMFLLPLHVCAFPFFSMSQNNLCNHRRFLESFVVSLQD